MRKIYRGHPIPAWPKERPRKLTEGKKDLVLIAGEDIGSFDACTSMRVLELVMAKDACVSFSHSVCELRPCSFDVVYLVPVISTRCVPDGQDPIT